jgi:uncharacterized protein YuzE
VGHGLTFRYDREAGILYVDTKPPYPEQESEEIGQDVVARLNPTTGEVENLEIMSFFTRLLRGDLFEVPVVAGGFRLPYSANDATVRLKA